MSRPRAAPPRSPSRITTLTRAASAPSGPSTNAESRRQPPPIGPLRYRNPSHESLPHLVKFSGGRSSAALVLGDGHSRDSFRRAGGCGPLANTSAEHPRTYEFAARCCEEIERESGLPCFWYEFCTVEKAFRSVYRRRVSYRLVTRCPIEEDPNGYQSRGGNLRRAPVVPGHASEPGFPELHGQAQALPGPQAAGRAARRYGASAQTRPPLESIIVQQTGRPASGDTGPGDRRIEAQPIRTRLMNSSPVAHSTKASVSLSTSAGPGSSSSSRDELPAVSSPNLRLTCRRIRRASPLVGIFDGLAFRCWRRDRSIPGWSHYVTLLPVTDLRQLVRSPSSDNPRTRCTSSRRRWMLRSCPSIVRHRDARAVDWSVRVIDTSPMRGFGRHRPEQTPSPPRRRSILRSMGAGVRETCMPNPGWLAGLRGGTQRVAPSHRRLGGAGPER